MKRPEIYARIVVPPDHIVLVDLSHNVTIKEIRSFLIIIALTELYLTRVKNIDYWSPSSFHNGPPTN